jgi:hypothetical protein
LGEVGRELYGAFEAGDGVVEVAGGAEREGEVVEGVGRLRLDGEDALVGGDCFVELAEVAQDGGEVVVCVGVTRGEGNGVAIGGDGFVLLAGGIEGFAEVVVEVRTGWIDGYGATNELCAGGVLAGL